MPLVPPPYEPIAETCPGCASTERFSDLDRTAMTAANQGGTRGRRYGLARSEQVALDAEAVVAEEARPSVEELERAAIEEAARQ